ncbi:MAG TPA: hypothetical protein VF747_05205, partial [Blastocatellia bacterium]
AMIPVIAAHGEAAPADGLEASIHYLLSDAEPQKLSLQSGQAIADSAYAWYQTHNLSIHAKTLAACLRASSPLEEGSATSARI